MCCRMVLTQLWSSYPYTATLKKWEAFYLEISFYLVYKSRSFLKSACQKPIQIRVMPKLGTWQKVRQLPNIYGVCLQANHKHKSINSATSQLTLTNTKRAKRENLHTWQANPKLLQARNSNTTNYHKLKTLSNPYKLVQSHNSKPITRT